ncbi:MAG: GAF domain-containing protein, partial [Desulfobacteraceae bacterium]|nr:GAF domain-containing protein [Desulfobacteraceae bacterium]
MQSELEFKNSGKITTALFKISNAVNTTDNLDDLYKSIHKTLNKIMDLSNFYIALYDKKKDCLAFPYFIDEKDDEDTVPLIQNVSDPETPSSTAWIIQSGKPLLFNKDYLIAHMKKIKKDVVGTPPCVWMGSPLKVKKEVIGVIVAQSYSDPALYNKKDLEIFNSVSDQVALAIERKRAQDAETESKTINKVLFSISNAVNTTENLDELYKSIHKTLGSIIDVTNFMIGVYDHKKDTITYPYYKDEIDNDFSEIKNVSKSGIIASEVINLAAPFIINKNEALKRAKKIGADIVGMVAEQWLGIPLRLKQKVIGVIVVQSYSNPELYSEKDIEILMAVSDQIAMAIDRKYAQEELKNSEKLTRTLFKISNAVNTTLNLDDLFKSIHKILAEVIDVTNFAIGIYNSKKDIMSYPYYVDATGDSYNEIQNVSSSGIIASEVINLAKPFFITGVEILERAKKIGARITEAIPPEQWLGVPLKTKNKAIGVIVVQSYSDPELYNQKDADILTSISDQVATAITRKQSEDAKKESEEIKKVLFAISNAVNTTRNLDELYKSIHTFLSKIIDLTNFIIGLYNKKNNTLSFEYFIDQFDDLHGTSVILDDGSSIGGGIIKSGSPIFLTEKDLKEKAKHNIGTLPKTWIGVPLKVDNEVIGYMAAQSYTDPDLFDHKDLEILSAVSDQVAIAIDRKRSEEALKIAKNAAEASAKSKSEFLANMS